MTHQVSGYYKSVEIQYSAKEGPQSFQVDAKLAEAVIDRLKGRRDGRLSNEDAEATVQDFRDGGKYGAGEKPIARALLAARDDRNVVTIDGYRVRLPDQAERTFTSGMQKFWGELGQKARGGATNTQQAVEGFASQQAGQQGQRISGQQS